MYLLNQSIGRYHILEQLGQGGMATVYKAYDTQLERDVALKMIRMDMFPAAAMERVLKRFEREAKALARLSHPNIVKIHDYGEIDHSPFFVMDLLEGNVLRDIKKPISVEQAVALLMPIAKALAYSHQHGIVHRDVKPSNIFITIDGVPMLTDFGIAKIVETTNEETLTGIGVGVGTPDYMAPEQGLGIEVDARADIYALGIIFFELISGRKPYTADTPMAVLVKQANDPIPRISSYNPDLPDAVQVFIDKCLSKRPEDRYENMDEFLANLMELRNGKSSNLTELVFLPGKGKKQEKTKYEEKTYDIQESLVVNNGRQTDRNGHFRKKQFVFGAGLVITVFFLFFIINSFARPIATDGIIIDADNDQAISVSYSSTPDLPTKTSTSTIISFTATPKITLTPTLGVGSSRIRQADGMVQVYVPAGEFIMGIDDEEIERLNELYCADEINQESCGAYFQYEKNITKFLDSFWIDQTEVTNGMYKQCINAKVCTTPRYTTSKTVLDYFTNSFYDEYPIINVTWMQASDYCEWVGGELPFTTEWEKAARGSNGDMYPWGDEFHGEYANLCDESCSLHLSYERETYPWDDGYADTAPVGSFPNDVSPYGVYDMAGNVSEFMKNNYRADRENPELYIDQGDSVSMHIMRGGAWNISNWELNFISFDLSGGYHEYYSGDDIGFRCINY